MCVNCLNPTHLTTTCSLVIKIPLKYRKVQHNIVLGLHENNPVSSIIKTAVTGQNNYLAVPSPELKLSHKVKSLLVQTLRRQLRGNIIQS